MGFDPATGIATSDEQDKPYLTLGNFYEASGIVPSVWVPSSFNRLMWPYNQVQAAIANGYLQAALPNPLSGYYIELPDGSSTTASLHWAHTGEKNSGLYRVAANDYSFEVGGTKVTEWLSAEFRVNYMTQGSVFFAGANGKADQNNASFFWDNTKLTQSVDNIASKTRPWCDVTNKNFGADPTGATSSIAAIRLALTAAGTFGTVYFPSGTYLWDDTLQIGDVEVTFLFAYGASIVHTGLGAKPAVQFTSGLTVFRQPIFDGMRTSGNNVSTDSLFELDDVNSRCRPIIKNLIATNWRTVIYPKAGDLSYVVPVVVKFYGGKITSPNVASPLFKTDNAAGTFKFGLVMELTDTRLGLEDASDPGWTLNFDGDIIGTHLQGFTIGGNSLVDGYDGHSSSLLMLKNNSTFEAKGDSYLSTDCAECEVGTPNGTGTGTLIVNRGQYKLDLHGSVTVQVKPGLPVSLEVMHEFAPTVGAICVDVLAGANDCSIKGDFLDNTTAAIRTAALRTNVNGCRFTSTGAHPTVLETGAANNTFISGSTGTYLGGGISYLGAASAYVAPQANGDLILMPGTGRRVGVGITAPTRTLQAMGIVSSIVSAANDTEIYLNATSTITNISATFGSTGAYVPMRFLTSDTERARIDINGNFLINTGAIATNAVNGFPCIPSCAGAPTGAPVMPAGLIPMIYDTTNNKIWFYNGAWRGVVVA